MEGVYEFMSNQYMRYPYEERRIRYAHIQRIPRTLLYSYTRILVYFLYGYPPALLPGRSAAIRPLGEIPPPRHALAIPRMEDLPGSLGLRSTDLCRWRTDHRLGTDHDR